MSLNYREINIVLQELALPGQFIQNIIQPSYDSIALYLYGKDGAQTLLISLAAGACRLHRTSKKIPRNSKPLRFMEFMRSKIKGAKILSAEQPGNDRVVYLQLGKDGGIFNMYIRLWSGAANIIVTDSSNIILDTFFRRPAKNETTGSIFTFTPPTDRPAKAYEARELPGTGSFCERLDAWYGEHEGTVSREALLEQARKKYRAQINRLANAAGHLEEKRAAFLQADRWKHQGDLIMTNIHTVQPGASALTCTDYETDCDMTIQLDPLKTAAENAESYYRKYKKAVSGLAELEQDIAGTKQEMQKAEEQLALLEQEENPLVIQNILRRQNTPKQQIAKKYPGVVFRKDGWLFLVGRSAAENDELLRRHVRGSDMWLHVRDWQGGYVFIKAQNGKSIPLDILLDGGTLAVFYSKARAKAAADVYYTPVKYLRRAKNGPKGLVLPTMEKNLYITLEDARLKKLEQSREESEK